MHPAFFHDLSLAMLVNLGLWGWLWAVPTFVVTVPWLPLGGLGMALPGVVLLHRRAALDLVLRHELVHQQQLRRFTPLGAALLLGWHYGKGFLRQLLRGRLSFLELWRSNPLEQEANRRMYAREPLPRLLGRRRR